MKVFKKILLKLVTLSIKKPANSRLIIFIFSYMNIINIIINYDDADSKEISSNEQKN